MKIPRELEKVGISCFVNIFFNVLYNNNNDRLTAFDPGQPG